MLRAGQKIERAEVRKTIGGIVIFKSDARSLNQICTIFQFGTTHSTA
jgi:hypothetical protein